MAEYGSSGLWEYISDETGPWRHTMTTYKRLGLSEDLIKSFKEWIQIYENDNFGGNLDHEAFNGLGLSLAFKVFEHLGRETHVEFQGENANGGLDEPIDIGNL